MPPREPEGDAVTLREQAREIVHASTGCKKADCKVIDELDASLVLAGMRAALERALDLRHDSTGARMGMLYLGDIEALIAELDVNKEVTK
jgi:hypothetical protein